MVNVLKYQHIPDEQVRTKSDRQAVDDGIYWDERAGVNLVNFCERFVYPPYGPAANKNLKLIDWQRDGLTKWACWKRPDGTRRFRKGCLFCARRQGKSLFGVCLSLYMWLADGEPGSYVVCTAVQRDQVKKVWFNLIWNSYQHWPESHRRLIDPIPSLLTLYSPKLNATLQGLSNEGWGKLGAPPHYAQLEEMAFWGNYDPLTAIETGVGDRSQPFILAVSTSGTDRSTPCWEWWKKAEGVLDGGHVDTEFLPLVFQAKPEDPIDDPTTWQKAAPSLSVTIPESVYETESTEAKRSKLAELKFKQFRLNQWVSSTNQFLPLDAFYSCALDPNQWPDLEGKDCWVGVDQSSSGGDLTAVVWIVAHDGKLYVQHHAWVSRAGVERVDQSHNLKKYSEWDGKGWFTIDEGNTVDQLEMMDFVRQLCERYKVQSIALDPSHNANHTYLTLKGEGLPVEPYGCWARYMNEPMRRLYDLVLDQTIAHAGDDLLKWEAQNLESKTNSMGQLSPHKPGESFKIDTMVALLLALAVHLRGTATPTDTGDFVISWA